MEQVEQVELLVYLEQAELLVIPEHLAPLVQVVLV
jgi:hypothetical protein